MKVINDGFPALGHGDAVFAELESHKEEGDVLTGVCLFYTSEYRNHVIGEITPR